MEAFLRPLVRQRFRSKVLAQNPADISALYISARAKLSDVLFLQLNLFSWHDIRKKNKACLSHFVHKFAKMYLSIQSSYMKMIG